MIRLLTGDFGSGKSTAIATAVRADVEEGRRAYLLVPEQGTLFAEQQMADLLPPSAPLCFEVTNFSRLANTVFRQEGGLSYRYATAAVRTLIMWRAMGELLPLLHEKGGEQEIGRVRKMAEAMTELSALGLTPAALVAAAKKLPAGDRLREKLEDLSLLSTQYNLFLHEKHGDVAEDLDRLAALLESTRFLAGAHLYVDGFVSFTEQQWRILRAAARTADLTVALTLPKARAEDLTFEETRDTYARLLRMAADMDVPLVRQDLGENKRTASPVLRGLLPCLFGRDSIREGEAPRFPLPEGDNTLRAVCAKDPFFACSYIAADIARRVKEEGSRYRDFAVIAHSADAYAGILDVCMADAGIPCFMAKKTDINSFAAVKLLYTAYAVCTGGWQREDVISYLKCGMSGIDEEDIDLFEIYVSRWKLYGRRFTDEVGWNMNPDGYRAELTARGAEVLRRVEDVRRRLVEQLAPLSDRPARSGVSEHCRALYEFMCRLGVEEQLNALAQAARVSQDSENADNLARLYGVLCDALDTLADTLGDTVVSATQFLDLLRLVLSEGSLARIPSALDQVTVGSADLLRSSGTRHVYLLGVNEGEFPATVQQNSIFSEGDRRVLQEEGLSIEPNLTLLSARELFCFARAFATACESVTLLVSEAALSGSPQRPAAVFDRVRALSGLPLIRTDALSPLDLLFSKEASADMLGILHGRAEGEALSRLLAQDERYRATVARLDQPLSEPRCRLQKQTADKLYGREIRLSQTRTDDYTKCPFAYFCKHVLHLDAAAVIEFDAANVGTLLHEILEKFFSRVSEGGGSIGDIHEAEISRIADEIIAEHISAVCPPHVRETPRFLHLLATLRRAALPVLLEMVEEFSQSKFRPTFFELGIDEGEKTPEGLPLVLPGGTRIRLTGRVDRVDTYEKDGKTYLRVIDYKSGDKSFSLQDVERGLNIQLLLYLITMWKSKKESFLACFGEGKRELMPAGVLYTGARIKDQACDSPAEAKKIAAELGSTLNRSGLLLDDPEILSAMDRNFSGRYIPVRIKNDGSYHAASQKNVATLERMGELVGEIEDVVCRIAGGIREGCADARPHNSEKDEKNKACEFCDMRAVCRSVEL